MLTRRGLFKAVAALGLGAMLPSNIFGELPAMAQISSRGDSQGPSAACQLASQDRPGEAMSLRKIEARDELLDSVDCMELAERYGSFGKVGGYLGGFLAGQCLFCRAGDLYVHPNEFRCEECETAGTALDFFAKMEGITDQEAVPRLAMLVESGSLQRRRKEQKVLWGIMSEASRYYHHLLCDTAEGAPGREWLAEHEAIAQVSERFSLGYFPSCLNGIRAELIEHLVARGYKTDIVQSAILPVGYPGILLPARDTHGHCWGLPKSLLPRDEPIMWSSTFQGMQRLAPHLLQRIVFSCPVGTSIAGFYPNITDGS